MRHICYRTVINDACCRPWEDMPEVQPPTFQALVRYLQEVCGIDPRPLAVAFVKGPERPLEEAIQGTRDGDYYPSDSSGTYLSYGERKQFWLPGYLSQEDRDQMEAWHAVPENLRCPVCGGRLGLFEEYTFGYHPEAYYAAYCEPCDLRFTKHHKMSRLAIDLVEAIQKAAARRLVLGK